MNKSSINQRFIISVNFLISEKKVRNKSEISEKLEISKSKFSEILNERMGIGVDLLANYCEKFELNPTWLLTGQGEMLKEELIQNNEVNEPIAKYELTKNTKKLIPIVSTEVAAGFGSDSFAITQSDVTDYCSFPSFEGKVDFMVPVRGTSMSPKYSNGNLVACKKITDNTFIQWNEIHVIATREQGLLLKRIKKSENKGFIIAISDNPDYPPFEIPESEITGIALVVGGVIME